MIDYVNQSTFCTSSHRLSGDFDWTCNFIFDSVEQYDLETNNFLNRFSELISDFRSYESKMIKSSPYVIFDEEGIQEKRQRVSQILKSIKKYDTLNERLQAIVESLVKYFDACICKSLVCRQGEKELDFKIQFRYVCEDQVANSQRYQLIL